MKCNECKHNGECVDECKKFEPKIMNNEKWFCGLNTKEKAEWLANEMRHNCIDYEHENQRGSWSVDFWEEWLQKEHKERFGVQESDT